MYIPFYNKTTYSFLSSLLEVDDLINIALEYKLDSIAICDNNMFGVMEFITKCKNNNINPIVGLDFNDRLLFAKNYEGYQNLLKLINIQSERELKKEDFLKYNKDLICILLDRTSANYKEVTTFFNANKGFSLFHKLIKDLPENSFENWLMVVPKL